MKKLLLVTSHAAAARPYESNPTIAERLVGTRIANGRGGIRLAGGQPMPQPGKRSQPERGYLAADEFAAWIADIALNTPEGNAWMSQVLSDAEAVDLVILDLPNEGPGAALFEALLARLPRGKAVNAMVPDHVMTVLSVTESA